MPDSGKSGTLRKPASSKNSQLCQVRIPSNSLSIAVRNLLVDIVVFDPNRISDKATFANPKQYPEGISYVLVNGHIVIDHGDHTGERPGVVLRGPGRGTQNSE